MWKLRLFFGALLVISFIVLALFLAPFNLGNFVDRDSNPIRDDRPNDKGFLENNSGLSGFVDTNTQEKNNLESGSNEVSSNNCYKKRISYSLQNFIVQEECNLFTDGNCVDKTVECSMIAFNFDDSIGGDFDVSIRVFEKGLSSENYLQEAFDTSLISSMSSQNFSETFNIQGLDAGKNLDCAFSTVSVPKIEVCS